VNEGVNIPPRGQISPLGARGEVKNGPLFTQKFIYLTKLEKLINMKPKVKVCFHKKIDFPVV
jgi:hypothetical protein